MRGVKRILLGILLASAPVYAQNDQVRRGPQPDWVVPSELMAVPEDAAGLAFVSRHDTLLHLDDQGQSHYQGFRIRILHPNALQLGNISIAWNPAAGAPTAHFIRVHRDGQVIDVLQNAAFEILRREDQLEASSLTGILTAILRVPDLRVGDELEVALTTRSLDPTFGANEAGLLGLGPSPSPGRFRLGLSWAESQEPQLKMTPDLAAVVERSSRAVVFDFDNPPMITPPQDAPPRYRWQRLVEYSDFPDWAAVSRRLLPLFTTAANLEARSPLREEARRIAATHSGPLDRARAALKLVQQEVRYVYVGLDGGNFTPASADQTWQRRYGDCKGKTALLLALLEELGIEAEPVMVSNSGIDDGLDERLPSPMLFDHVLVRALIDGSTYWLDGTLPPAAGPSMTPVMPYRWVLPLKPEGGSIERQQWRPLHMPDELTLFEIDARAGFDRPARIVSTMVVRGVDGLQQYFHFSSLTPAQLLAAMQQSMVGDTWQEIDEARWRYDEATQASILTISGTGTVDWEGQGGSAKWLTLPGGGFSPPQRRVRPPDQNQDLPYYNEPGFDCWVTTVRLPESTQESHWRFNSAFDTRMFGRNYYRTFDIRDGALRMVRASRVEQLEIDAHTARRDNARIAGFDNSTARANYDPATRNPLPNSRPRVPATDEIDWTSGDVPCLSSRAAASSEVHASRPGEPVRARGNIHNLISYMDYPVEALRTRAEGTVRVRLSVDASGIVTDCGIISSSGHEILDNATCELMRSRAAFTPARNGAGNPVPDTVNSPPIRWQIVDLGEAAAEPTE